MSQNLTVSQLIKTLKKCKNKKESEIEIFNGKDNFKIVRIGQFGIVTDVTIELKKI